jgi:hypothetical protein
VFVVAVALSVIALARAQRFYGTIYHGWDAQFYYTLARSLVLDHDVDVSNDVMLTPSPRPLDPDGDRSFRNVPRHPDGRIWSKFRLGLSLVEAPLLAAGIGVRRIAEAAGFAVTGPPGYSLVELWTVALGLIAVFAAGLAVLYRLLVDEYGVAAALVGIAGAWIGTSLFYYSSVFPFMTHAISFALLAVIMALSRKVGAGGDENRRLLRLGAALAALFLVRPQQTLIAALLIPLLVPAVRALPRARWLPGLLGAALIGAACVTIQVAFSLAQAGTVTGYAPGGEHFRWGSPSFAAVLFGRSTGLLRFSPIVAVAAAGYVAFARAIPGYAWAAAGNALAQLYVIAAFSAGQGDTFGARMWSDNAATVAVGLAVIFRHAAGTWRRLMLAATVAAIGWTTVLLRRYIVGA